MEVSVIVIAPDRETNIRGCLESLLQQSYRDLEVIVVDECSGGAAAEVVKGLADTRLQYIKNEKSPGVGSSLNAGLKQAKGEFIFFTRPDCVPVRWWIEEGVRLFKEEGCQAIYGMTFYATARVTFSHRPVPGIAGRFLSDNAAYKREALDKTAGFDPKFKSAFEGQSAGYLVEALGKTLFSPEMIVVRQRGTLTVSKMFKDAQRARDAVYFVKKHPDYPHFCREIKWKRVLFPGDYLVLFCPLLLVIHHSFRGWQDIKLLPFAYLNILYTRLLIWQTAVKEGIFLI